MGKMGQKRQKKNKKSEAKGWQAVTQQKIDKCLDDQSETTGWKAAAQRKINKCLDDQNQVKVKGIAHKKMQEGLEQIQKAQENEVQERVRKIDTKNIESAREKAGEVIDTYETIQVSKLTNPVEESMTEVKKPR